MYRDRKFFGYYNSEPLNMYNGSKTNSGVQPDEEERSFYSCDNLLDVSIPQSAEEIGSSAFENTLWLEKVKGICTAGFICAKVLLQRETIFRRMKQLRHKSRLFCICRADGTVKRCGSNLT